MEELRSTEALDREVLEDARRKAFKILKTADETAAAQVRRWEETTAKDLDALRASSRARLETERGEILARLPLDKKRLRSRSTEGFLRDAMKAFLDGVSRERRLTIVEREFSTRLAACPDWGVPAGDKKTAAAAADRAPRILYTGMTEAEALEVVKNAFAGRDAPAGIVDLERGGAGDAGLPALTLETRAVRISASVEAAAADLLEARREDLVKALLGEEAVND